jgi:hypothetical protein
MAASAFDRLHPAISAVVVDIDAEADFRRLPDEVAAFARRIDADAVGDMHAAIAGSLPRRKFNARPHVRTEVLAFELVMSLARSGVCPSEDDLRAGAVALGRRQDVLQGSLSAWGEAFGGSVGAAPPGIDTVEWAALQLIVALRQRLASGMAARRALVGILAWCHVLGRVPPAVVLVAFGCVVGIIDSRTAAPIWPRLTVLAGVDAHLALAIAARDVEAGGRASGPSLARTFPNLTRQRLWHVRESRGCRLARASFRAQSEAELASLYADTATPLHMSENVGLV